MKRTVFVLALLAVVLMTAGCSKKAPQTAVLKVASNPTTGYEWTYTQDPEIFTITSEYAENGNADGAVGVGGTVTYTLIPIKKGTSDVTFTYARSWEEEADTTLSYTLKVNSNMQIEVESFRGAGGTDIDTLPDMPQFEIR